METETLPSDPEYEDVLEGIKDYIARLLAAGHCGIYQEVMEEVERRVFGEVLKNCGSNKTLAAERLGISQVTLRTRLKRGGVLMSGYRPMSQANRRPSRSTGKR